MLAPSAEQRATAAREVWAPLPGSQTAFLACPIFEVLIEGTRGGGKTQVLLMDFAQFVDRGFGEHWRGILFRESYKQLDDVVAKSKLMFQSLWPAARFNSADYVWVFPRGERLFLRHIQRPDDYWNYHGHEYPWVGFEELTNWMTSDCYLSMMSTCRSAHPGMPRHYRATSNPFGRGHNWVKRRFVDPAPAAHVIRDDTGMERVRIRSFLSENTKMLASDPLYARTLASIENPNKRRAWLFGDWDVTSGGMFDDIWDSSVHALEPFPIPPSWRLDRGFDWGSSRPFAYGLFAESDGSPAILADGSKRHFPRGTVFLIAEWYGWTGKDNEGTRMLAKEVGRGILEREERWGYPRGRVAPGPADASIFDIDNGNSIANDLESVGCYFTASDKSKHSRTHGWEQIRKRLKAAVDKEDAPQFYVFNTCRQWLRTVPSLPRDEKNSDDVDTDAEDHCGDMTRYRLWSGVPTMNKVGIVGF